MKQPHDTIKRPVGKYSKSERPVNGKESKPITEIQGQRNRWMEHSEKLLNRPASMNPPDIEAVHTDIPIHLTPQTIKEIRMTIRQIDSGKSVGPNSEPAEALK
ncbi:hypothetical protein MS3_00000135 [Schistosoma haematobium]|uniref:Uncharacterized protein n=1 Tax=Schistosoma haematobium TaxID=6185 RepID=A0A922S5G8_SCHHA|nr:hypothetical protein MS3_00000135 [Schistosoma haematobium]KAH9594348.1 hypothetical protein MS3_00000135 [Schistosoma haematobium]CAH8442711.1 unnamed protein product [Schistosoma haematobium]